MSAQGLHGDEKLGGLTETTPDQSWKTATTVLAFVFLVAISAAYLAFIHHYAVNSVFYDQWWDIQLLGHWYSGTLTMSDLWAQHGENRILFQNLVMLLLARTVHLNTIVEQYLSGVLLVSSTVLIIWTHKRRSPSVNWLWYVPVAALLLSFVQYGDTLFGFQLGWYMVYFSLALSLFLLDRPKLTWVAFGIAVISTIVGTYSSLQGLLIWPVGLLLLYQRNRSRRMNVTWSGVAVIATVLYFYNLSFSATSGYVFKHPFASAKFFFVAIGDVLGLQLPQSSDSTIYAVMVLGLIIFVLACSVLFTFGRHRDERSGAPFGVALIAYGLLFAALTTSGEAQQGLATAATPRYTTFDLLIPVGCALTLLSAWTNAKQQETSGTAASPRDRMLLKVASATLGAVILLAVLFGASDGLSYGSLWSYGQQQIAWITVNDFKFTDAYLDTHLLDGCPNDCGLNLRQLLQVAQEHHLSTFGTRDAAIYAKEGLTPDTVPPTTGVILPASGSTQHGDVLLSAGATSDIYMVTDVDFLLSGNGLRGVRIAKAAPSFYGWLARWDTATVPNGSYLLQSVVHDAAGTAERSPGVPIQVANP